MLNDNTITISWGSGYLSLSPLFLAKMPLSNIRKIFKLLFDNRYRRENEDVYYQIETSALQLRQSCKEEFTRAQNSYLQNRYDIAYYESLSEESYTDIGLSKREELKRMREINKTYERHVKSATSDCKQIEKILNLLNSFNDKYNKFFQRKENHYVSE